VGAAQHQMSLVLGREEAAEDSLLGVLAVEATQGLDSRTRFDDAAPVDDSSS
jgi:hypothetical protein